MEQQPSSSPTPFTPASARDSFLDDSSRPQPEIPHQVRPISRRGVILSVLVFAWKTLVLPAMGLAYLTFCYVCHYHIVKIGGIKDPMAHLALIKAGVTSISILFVSISLLPLYSLISDLKSEEFFRLLSIRNQGIPLETINYISTPSYGLRDSLVTLYRRHASLYFTAAFLASLLALATSTLAPAVLSVGTVLFDGDLVALSIGAIQRNTVLNMSNFADPQFDIGPTLNAIDKVNQAGAVAWAEFTLGVNYSFQSPTVDQTTFIIPTPPKLSSQTSARWLSDVIAMRPACEWIAPDFDAQEKVNISESFSETSTPPELKMNLTSKNIQVSLRATSLGLQSPALEPLESKWSNGGLPPDPDIMDLNTMDDITNGAMVFYFKQCAAGCNEFSSPINVTISPDIHTARYHSTDGKAVDISFLYCDPKAEIQTREINHDGKGALSLGDKASIPQGNLHPVYTSLLLSYSLINLKDSGPQMPSNISELGNQVQFSMFFGNPSLSSTQISMQSVEQLTASYTSILKSAMKPFMDGSLASTHVPARTTREIAIFASSPPHFIASTVLYVLLTVFVLACHFRRHAAQFTFFAIASRLARSDMPSLFAELKKANIKRSTSDEDVAVSSLKKARVLLEGGEVLRLRNDI